MLFLTRGNIVPRGKIGEKTESVIPATKKFLVEWKIGTNLSVTALNRITKGKSGVLEILDSILYF